MSAEFTVGAQFQSDRRTPLRFIWSHIRRHPLLAVLMIIGAFSNAALAYVMPGLIGQAFNAVSAGATMAVIGMLALGIIASQVGRAILQVMRNLSSETFAQRIERDVRDELYANLLGKSMSYHDMQPVGEIMARVTNDVREMNLMMNPGVNLIVGSSFFLIMPVFAALIQYPPLVLTPILFLIFYVLGQYWYIRQLHPAAQVVRKDFGDMNASVAETLEGLQVVKGAAQEQREQARFATYVDRVRESVARQGSIEATYPAFLALGLAMAFGFAHAAILHRQGIIDTGDIISYTTQLMLLGFPVFTSAFSFSQAALGYASAKRILEILNTQSDLDQNAAGYGEPVRGAIQFEHVDFGYTTAGERVLHDISFTVQVGQTVAIVGQTGAGKSTITKLLNRTYDVDAGRVLVDGVDVRAWDLARLRSQISVIEQDIFLFSRSIADNIRFGKPDATQEEVEAAARKAQAHEFILSFPEGYETVVGQRGVTLSGGQRQRLALARAFVTDPPILVLDDSTSAIDSATEDLIQRAIWAAAQGRTTIIITHRLSQIRWADHIVVLKQGRVAAQGTHDDLMATSESYRRIFARYEAAEPVVQ